MITSTKHSLLIALFVASFANTTSAQTIKGTVTKAGSGEPLPGVNVYLSGTTFGQATDQNGSYTISPSSAGRYDLVFSFVGYKKEIRRIELRSNSSMTIDVEMEEDIHELGEIKIVTSNKEWQRRYEFFFDQFIGKTPFARETTIENRWVLEFTEPDNNLVAKAHKPIIVINRALGYKIYIELIQFDWPNNNDRGGVYQTYNKYEQLVPESDQQLHRWQKNRIEAYLGSFSHFLKSLYDDNLKENNFSIDKSYRINRLEPGETRYKLLSRPGTSPETREHFKGFELAQQINVEFKKLVTYQFNDDNNRLSIRKNAGVAPNFKSRTFFVDERGMLLNPISLKVYGRWASDRMANSMPTNYSFE